MTRWAGRIGLAISVVLGGPAMADDVDTAALARVRPGDDVSVLQAAMGEAWRAPLAHREGTVDILENSHAFVARLTAEGTVGEVKYTRLFDPEPEIEGLRIQMPLDQARAARPDIKVSDEMKMGPPMRFGSLPPSEGRILRVMYNFDKVYEITISDPGAVYPAKLPVPYAEPSGDAGAPFADKNFKLVVLSDLIDNKAIDIGTEEELAAHVLGRPVDLEDEGYDLIPEAAEYLYRYPLTPEVLAAVTRITLDGGNTIYRYAYYFWGGETEDFDVVSIAGIEACPNVELVEIISMTEHLDLRPLLALKNLRHVTLSMGPGPFSDSNAAVMDTLRERGVAVK